MCHRIDIIDKTTCTHDISVPPDSTHIIRNVKHVDLFDCMIDDSSDCFDFHCCSSIRHQCYDSLISGSEGTIEKSKPPWDSRWRKSPV